MSDMKKIMKFEYLPNEILIECFRYLNALQLFQSFDQHNYRFNQLIRSIKLHLDFQNIPQKLIHDTFCTKILPDQEIKKRIDSIHLSNENIYYPIQWFLSIFSLNKFLHLRSLTLTKLKKNNLKDLKTMLPAMTELFSFRMINCDYQTQEILCALPLFKLRTLIIPKLPRNLKLMDKALSITNLTISFSDFDDLSQIFNSTSKLKYLRIENVQRFYLSAETKNVYSINNYATYLNRLIIMKFRARVDDLFIILKQTSNLRSLTINARFNKCRIDADEWEDLINTSLPYLNVFKFYFEWEFANREENEVSDKLKQFQSDFWCKQHHWYTEYILSRYRTSIYTIPYVFDSYSLEWKTNRYSNPIMNNIITFDNVKDLTVDPSAITEKYQYRFSYVTSLTFQYVSGYNKSNRFLRMEDIKHLKMIVNLSHVKHLSLTMVENLGKLESVLTEILKEGKQISSLEMNPTILEKLFDTDELCKYLNKMIKKLNIPVPYSYGGWYCSPNIKQMCQVFSNLEQLSCDIEKLDVLLFVIQNLSKLTFIHVSAIGTDFRGISWLEKETHKLGIKIIIEINDDRDRNFSIWIIRNIS